MIKKNNGITLIALVVTIVVTIIIASIAISTLLDDDSVIEQSSNAKESAEISRYEEQLEIIKTFEYEDGTQMEKIDFLYKYAEAIKNDDMFKDAKEVVVDEAKEVVRVVTEEGYVLEASIYDSTGETAQVDISKVSITLSKTPSSWTNGEVEVTIGSNFNVTKKYSLDNGISWNNYGNPIRVSNNGTEIQAKGVNRENEETNVVTEIVNNIDRLPPNQFIPKLTGTNQGIIVQANTDDASATDINGQSGIRGYQFSINGGDWTSIVENGQYEFRNLVEGTTYSIRAKAIDNAENETISNPVSGSPTNNIPPAEGNIKFASNPETWTNQSVKVSIETSQSNYGIQYSLDGNTYFNYTTPVDVSKNQTIYARHFNGNAYGTETSYVIDNIDKLPPKDSSVQVIGQSVSSISVRAEATDADATQEYGSSGIRGYQFSADGGKTWSEETTENTYTFRSLTQNSSFDVMAKAIDNAGNDKNSEVQKAQTGTLPNINDILRINKTPTNWTSTSVSVTIDQLIEVDEYIVEYSKDNANWNTYFSGQSITVTNNNETVYARLRNPNTNETTGIISSKITNIDRLPPNNFTPSLTVSTDQITVRANNVTDAAATSTNGCSGIRAYIYSMDGRNWTSEISNNVYTFSGLTPGQAYTVTVIAVDNAGNMTTSQKISGTTTAIPGGNANIFFSYSETNWTKNDVVVTITASTSKYKLQYSFNGRTWYDYDSYRKITMTSNGQIYARLIDNNGNYGATATGEVYNIDKDPPTATYSTSQSEDEVTIYLYPRDTLSGVNESSITCTNGNVQKINNTTYKVTANGTYTFTFQDYAKNQGSTSVTIQNIEEKKLRVGDYVNYIPNGETSITTTDLGANNTMPVEDLDWIVLDIRDDGMVELIAETPTDTRISASYTDGYNNCVYVFNDLMNRLYKNPSVGATARNIKVEDVTSKIKDGFNYIESVSDFNEYGTTSTFYGQYYYPTIWEDEEGSQNMIDGRYNNGTLGQSEQNSKVYGIKSTSTSISIKTNYLHLSSSTRYNMKTVETRDSTTDSNFYWNTLCSPNTTYFYSTRMILIKSADNYPSFGYCWGPQILGTGIHITPDSMPFGQTHALRPIVTLPASAIDISIGHGEKGDEWGIK